MTRKRIDVAKKKAGRRDSAKMSVVLRKWMGLNLGFRQKRRKAEGE